MDESENKQLRMASILVLGDIGDKETIRSLRELSYGEDGLVLYHALKNKGFIETMLVKSCIISIVANSRRWMLYPLCWLDILQKLVT